MNRVAASLDDVLPQGASPTGPITVVGEALMDLVDRGDGTIFHARPGGSPYNVAIAAARLGRPTRLLARLASDRFGQLLRAHALANGVDLSGTVSAAQPSTAAVASIDRFGGASYDFYVQGTADWHWTAGDLERFDHSAIVHFGSLASWTAPGDSVVREAVARAQALITYDPNIRPGLMGSRRQAQPVVDANVALADVVKASDEDLAWLYPNTPPHEVAAHWLTARPTLVVVTAGRSGATAYRAGRPPMHRPAFPVDVVDTVGAGDSWTGALLALLHRADAVKANRLDDLSEAELADLLDEAQLAASLTCTRQGADPPTAEELKTARRGSDAVA